MKNLEEHNQRKINKSIKKLKHHYLPGGLIITFTERRKFATKAKGKLSRQSQLPQLCQWPLIQVSNFKTVDMQISVADFATRKPWVF